MLIVYVLVLPKSRFTGSAAQIKEVAGFSNAAGVFMRLQATRTLAEKDIVILPCSSFSCSRALRLHMPASCCLVRVGAGQPARHWCRAGTHELAGVPSQAAATRREYIQERIKELISGREMS